MARFIFINDTFSTNGIILNVDDILTVYKDNYNKRTVIRIRNGEEVYSSDSPYEISKEIKNASF